MENTSEKKIYEFFSAQNYTKENYFGKTFESNECSRLMQYKNPRPYKSPYCKKINSKKCERKL